MMGKMKSKNIKNSLYLFLSLLFVYVILFEFILPINRVLPKPTVLFESFSHLWAYYNFGMALASTIGVVYISIGLGFILTWLLRSIIIKLLLGYVKSINTLQLFRYFPAFFFVILFTFWFDASITAQFIFSTLAFIFLLIQNINLELPSVREEYKLVAVNLNPAKFDSEIFWFSILPKLFIQMKKIHYYIWTLVLLYEFVSNSFGLGSIYRSILEYNDFGALITVALVISLLIWLGSFLIQFAKNKLASWEA